jgi:uncharacterized metal-binding protein
VSSSPWASVLVGSFTCPLAPFLASHGLSTTGQLGHQAALQRGGTSSSTTLVAPGQDLQVVVMPLADRPWDPMSCECGVLSLTVSLTVATQGGELQKCVVHPEPKIVLDCCSEVPRWVFDPMLVEVEDCLTDRPTQMGFTCQAVSKVAQVVDQCLSSLDVCGSAQTSPRPSLLEPE